MPLLNEITENWGTFCNFIAMKRLQLLAAMILLIWYSGILWHTTIPAHGHEDHHHHHPGGHHHGLLSIIVDLIHDLQHDQPGLDKSELFVKTKFRFTLKRFDTANSDLPHFQNKDPLILPTEGRNREHREPQPGFLANFLSSDISYRGPPTTA